MAVPGNPGADSPVATLLRERRAGGCEAGISCSAFSCRRSLRKLGSYASASAGTERGSQQTVDVGGNSAAILLIRSRNSKDRGPKGTQTTFVIFASCYFFAVFSYL